MNFRKYLILLLTIILFLGSIPLKALADSGTQEKPVNPPVNDTEMKIPVPQIVGELINKRGKNVKQFLLNNNTYEAVVYPKAVHYKENGQWKDIDNSLVENNDQTYFENKQNAFKVHFSKTTQANHIVTIQKNNYQLSWNFEDIQPTKAVIHQNDLSSLKNLTKNEKFTTLTHLTSEINYPSAFQNADLTYDVEPEAIKEKIIIKQPVIHPSYVYHIKTNTLQAKLNEDKTVTFYDSGHPNENVYTIESPVMVDANGQRSKDIQVKLVKEVNGYLYTVTPNNNWLNSGDRSDPITLDPTLSTSLDSTKIFDNTVSEGYPTTNYYNSIINKVGYGSSSKRNRTFIKFDLPQLSTADMITGAFLAMNLYSDNTIASQVDIHKVTGSWGTNTITWNNQPAYDSSVTDYQIAKGTAGASYLWDITDIAKSWYTTGDNNGLMLRSIDETTGYSEFVSSDTGSAYASYRPQVTLYYVNNAGLESYWTYHSQDVGRAGTGYVNDYNGNIVFIHDDLGMNGNRLPVSISHIYNSTDKGSNIGYGNG